MKAAVLKKIQLSNCNECIGDSLERTKTVTVEIKTTDATERSEVIRASGVLVEQKPVRPNLLAFCSRWSHKRKT